MVLAAFVEFYYGVQTSPHLRDKNKINEKGKWRVLIFCETTDTEAGLMSDDA